jgi:hypothetical protein
MNALHVHSKIQFERVLMDVWQIYLADFNVHICFCCYTIYVLNKRRPGCHRTSEKPRSLEIDNASTRAFYDPALDSYG